MTWWCRAQAHQVELAHAPTATSLEVDRRHDLLQRNLVSGGSGEEFWVVMVYPPAETSPQLIARNLMFG